MGADLISNLLHRQLLVGHPLSVQLKTKEPWGDTGHVKVRHFIVDIDKLLVFGNDCVLRFGIVVDCCVGCDLTQSGVLNATENILYTCRVWNMTVHVQHKAAAHMQNMIKHHKCCTV